MATKLLENSSFALVRTNPKLTTNVKVVVDGEDRIYLESFNANKELSKSKYKANQVSNKSTYDYDLSRFYRRGETPAEVAFDVFRPISDLSVQDDFADQYEFEYTYGASSINSKTYSEEFGVLAPIWLERTIPDYFIIFRIDGPVAANNLEVSNENENKSIVNEPDNFVDLILKKSTLIKTYDLTEKSEIGKYIRNFKSSERFPISPLNFSTERNQASFWNGIDLKKGGFVSKSEFSYDRIFSTDSTIMEDEFYITGGYQRNNIAIANIMNLQFLFDDNDVDDFSINRYFGLYVNSIDEGRFQVSGEKLFRDNKSDQSPKAPSTDWLVSNNTKELIQENQKGIKIYINPDTLEVNYTFGDIDNDTIPDLDKTEFLPSTQDVDELVSIFYVKDKNGNFHNIKTGSNWKNGEELRLADTSIDWSKFTGEGDLVLSTKGNTCAQEVGKASTFLRINSEVPHGDRYAAGIIKRQSYEIIADNIVPGDIVTISDGNNSISVNIVNNDKAQLYDSIRTAWINSSFTNFKKFNISAKNDKIVIVEKNKSAIDINFIISTSSTSSQVTIEQIESASIQPFVITADASLIIDEGTAHGRFFNPRGTNNEIAKAMASAFNNIKDRLYDATAINNVVVLVARIGGTRFNDISIARDIFLEANHVEILSNSPGISHPDFKIQQFEGGSEDCRSRIAVDIEARESFNTGKRYLKVIDQTGDSNNLKPVKKASFYIDEPIKNNKGEVVDYKNFDSLCTVNVDDGEVIYTDVYKNVYLYELYKIPFGRFSIFPIKDMDIDFYSEEYGDEKELNSESKFYSQFGDISSDFTHADIEDFYENTEFTSLQSVLQTEESDLILNSPKIKSEYNRLKENYLKPLSVPSRITPYINKWVYRNGKNVREHDYRLASSEAFGITNFSPSKDEFEREPDYFTHEWYYLQKLPPYFGYLGHDSLNDVFSYFPEELDVTETGLMNVNEDYFTEYFTVDLLKYPQLDTGSNSVTGEFNVPVKKQLRYSTFEGGSNSNFSTAFHRGVKVIMKERVENNIEIDFNLQNIKLKKSNRFNNYKFSCVLIPHNDEYPTGTPRKRVEVEFIENRKYKHVTLVIYAKINDLLTQVNRDVEGVTVIDDAGFIDRTTLYSLSSKYESINTIDLNTDGTMPYADVELSGAIDMRLSSGTNFGSGKVSAIEDINGDSPRFLDEIIVNENGSYNSVIATSGVITREFQVVDVLNDNELEGTSFTGGPQPGGLSDIQVESGNYIYVDGGFNYWENRLNRLSYASLAELINDGSPDITYKTILPDGTVERNKFIVELQTAKEVVRPNYLKPVSDNNKPVNFNLTGTIGYELNYADNARVQPLYRHSGFFQPKFIDVITFEDPYIIEEFENPLEKRSQIRKNLKDANTQIKINDDFAKIKNLYYHKVNDSNPNGVLELTKDSAFQPLYPLIGEIAIDKRDFYMWQSNWDASYFRKHITKTQTENVIGTRSIKEKKSFFASKIMKILDELQLETFTSIEASSEEELSILHEEILQPDNEFDLAYYITESQITMNIYVEKKLTRVLYEAGIFDFFSKYIRPDLGFGTQDSLDDDVFSYIKRNILPRYRIGKVDLYGRKSRQEDFNNQFPVINSNLSDGDKQVAGLTIQNQFTSTLLSSRSNFNTKLIYNKTSGFKYTIAPSFKIIKK